ncbi:SDR family oxidoreductase [Niabella terrae]
MKIVVIGGTGLIGSNLVQKLQQRGQNVLAASPATGVNSLTGEGLDAALKDSEVLVDVSNSPSFEDQAVLDFFETSGKHLVEAARKAGIRHYVAMSVVGADRLPASGYLRAKVAQEAIIQNSGISYSILRSTQFFEFADRIAASATVNGEVHISPAVFQPIASDEVVAALADVVSWHPLNGITEVAGPERIQMSEFIRYFLKTTGDPRQVVEDPHAPYFGSEIDDHSLVPAENPRLGKQRYQDWLRLELAKV